MLRKFLHIIVLCTAATSFNAHAQFDIFLKLEPFEEFKGEVQDEDHGEEIEVIGWSWGLSNQNSLHSGTPSIGATSFQDISITKLIDTSSTSLYLRAANGLKLDRAILTVRTGGSIKVEILIITMTDVLVTSVSTGGQTSEDEMTENITLNFASYCVRYTSRLENGSAGPFRESCFDIQNNVEP